MTTLTLRTQIKENHLTCSVCFNRFSKPKALPCLHTYCQDCLRDYIVSRGYEATGSFPCPVCRTTIPMPETGVEGFPDNHLMLSLSDTVEMATPSRPVPKPRKSLGQQQQPQVAAEEPLPPPYSSVADTNPAVVSNTETSSSCEKVCLNDTEPDWMVVPRQAPSAPSGEENGATAISDDMAEFYVVSVTHSDTVPSSTSSASQISGPTMPALAPVQPPPYSSYPSSMTNLPVYPNLNSLSDIGENPNPPVGWNLNALGSMHCATENRNNGNDPNFGTHIPHEDAQGRRQANSSPVLYPTVPPHADYNNVACTENLLLKFGKQGASVRDFLKPVGLAVSKEGNYIISDSSGDQNRIFVYDSGGELTAAFKSGCKVKDITMTKNNEIYAAVHKSIAAIRHFTMSGQLKGEYGKFFTYEMPCGIAVLKNGGAVLTGTQNHCVYVLTGQMKLGLKFGRKGNGDGYFQHPGFIAVNSKDHIIVTDKINNSVQLFNPDGKFKHRFGLVGSNHGNLRSPMGVCVDAEDNIIVADSDNYRVEVFTPKGRWVSTVVRNTHELGEKVKPVNVAVTPTGKIAVLLRGPYFAEVRVYSSRHLEILHQKEGPVSTTSSVWYTTSNK